MKKNDIDNYEITDTHEITDTQELSINRFKTKEGRSAFKVRLISAIVLLILLVAYVSTAAIYTYLDFANVEIASYFTIGATAILICMCLYEINKATNFNKWYHHLVTFIVILMFYLFPVKYNLYNFSFYQDLNMNDWLQLWQFFIFIPLILTIYFLFGFLDKNIGLTKLGLNLLITFMIAFAFKGFTIVALNLEIFADKTQTADFSFNTIIWIWLMIILSDSFAYIGGMACGKTQLAPKISPKKTWEGAAIGLSCGFIFGSIYAIIFLFFVPDFKPFNYDIRIMWDSGERVLPILMYLLMAVAFPVIGLFGDLIFSWVKRIVGIKDYSNLIPGHGGLLDRLDSIIFSWFILFFIVIFL